MKIFQVYGVNIVYQIQVYLKYFVTIETKIYKKSENNTCSNTLTIV